MWYFSVFKQHKTIWPDADQAAEAVTEVQRTQAADIVSMAELLYAIFGIHGRCRACITDGINWACITLSRIPDKDKNAKYKSLLETFARIQM